MRIIKSYKLFESEDALEMKIDPIDLILDAVPELREDKFTRVILPSIRTITWSKFPEKIKRSINRIKEIAIKKFGGFESTIPLNEVLDRFVNHYIERPDGIIDSRAIENLVDFIGPRVHKGAVKSKGRIGKESIDSFTDHLRDVLMRVCIKDSDVDKQIKKIYIWALPILLHFYNPDELKTFRYMQEGVIFTRDELDKFLKAYEQPDSRTPQEGGIKAGLLHGKRAKKIQAK
jgi:hypothetical protein